MTLRAKFLIWSGLISINFTAALFSNKSCSSRCHTALDWSNEFDRCKTRLPRILRKFAQCRPEDEKCTCPLGYEHRQGEGFISCEKITTWPPADAKAEIDKANEDFPGQFTSVNGDVYFSHRYRNHGRKYLDAATFCTNVVFQEEGTSSKYRTTLAQALNHEELLALTGWDQSFHTSGFCFKPESNLVTDFLWMVSGKAIHKQFLTSKTQDLFLKNI